MGEYYPKKEICKDVSKPLLRRLENLLKRYYFRKIEFFFLSSKNKYTEDDILF